MESPASPKGKEANSKNEKSIVTSQKDKSIVVANSNDEQKSVENFKSYLEEQRRQETNWNTYKSVDDLIKHKIQQVETSKGRESSPTKEEEDSNSLPFNSGNSQLGTDRSSVQASKPSKENKETMETADSEEPQLRMAEKILKEAASMGVDALRVSLLDQLEFASSQVNKAREASRDPALREKIKKSRIPIGFEDVKEDEKGAYFDEIIDFLNPFFMGLMELTQDQSMNGMINLLKEHMKKYDDKKKALMKTMNISRMIVPYISLDLPNEIILAYNRMEETDPLVAVFRLHPVIGDEIEKFGVFLDRWDTNKEVICSLVWSNTDNAAVTLPVVGLNPYPTCWNCESKFGTFTCGKCAVAKYCSRDCQVASWKVFTCKGFLIHAEAQTQMSRDRNSLQST